MGAAVGVPGAGTPGHSGMNLARSPVQPALVARVTRGQQGRGHRVWGPPAMGVPRGGNV